MLIISDTHDDQILINTIFVNANHHSSFKTQSISNRIFQFLKGVYGKHLIRFKHDIDVIHRKIHNKHPHTGLSNRTGLGEGVIKRIN